MPKEYDAVAGMKMFADMVDNSDLARMGRRAGELRNDMVKALIDLIREQPDRLDSCTFLATLAYVFIEFSDSLVPKAHLASFSDSMLRQMAEGFEMKTAGR